MAIERTYAMIKPDATERNLIGKIVARIEEEGFKVVAMRKVQLSLREVQAFYGVHSERPFFGELTEFMSSGPIVGMCLEREDAIAKWREVMGATNPADADEGTLRKLYARSLGENSVHGSDATETAAEEMSLIFRGLDLI